MLMHLATKPQSNADQKQLFIFAMQLMGVIFCVELCFFYLFNDFYIKKVAFLPKSYHLPVIAILPFVYLLVTHLLLLMALGVTIAMITLAIVATRPVLRKDAFSILIYVWAFANISILIFNQNYVPNSKFSNFLSFLIPSFLASYLSYLCAVIWAGLLLIAINYYRKLALSIFCLCVLSYSSSYLFPVTVKDAASADRPNVILIGVDSLRPDFIGYFNGDRYTPHLTKILNQSAVFSDAITPLARTFPSWVSILTGLYPNQSHVRANLTNIQNPKSLPTLPSILQKNGYNTVFATDEVRFSNIDRYYGFDNTITPPMGIDDFLIGTFNDFPISNLLINTKLGQWFFPYNYANRAAGFSYDPDSFIARLRQELPKTRTSPVFLAVHFCLPHFPYQWISHVSSAEALATDYEMATARADQQVGDLYAILKEYGLLQHAIVIVLSDHGEALNLTDDRLLSPVNFIGTDSEMSQLKKQLAYYGNEAVDLSAGHGTEILSMTQYHILLAFQLHGLKLTAPPAMISGMVSLIDLKPTILDLLKIPSASSGVSLLNQLSQPNVAIHSRPLYVESGFTPTELRRLYVDTSEIVDNHIQRLAIKPGSTQLIYRPETISEIIKSKQRGVFFGSWYLALYPTANGRHDPYLINLKTGQWTTNLKSSFALTSPAEYMLKLIHHFYGNELNEPS